MQEDVKKTRLRSPAYPAISLKEAIERVKALYDQDKTAVVPMETAAKHIGFAKAHGQAVMFLSALRKFGLVEYPSDGRVVITRRAVEILTFPEGHERKVKAIQEAALSPVIYSELFDKYRDSGLPSDEAISAELIADSGFNPSAVVAFLEDFRDSLEYAGLLSNGVLSLSRDESKADNGAGGDESPKSRQSPIPDLFSPTFNQTGQSGPPTSGVKLMEGERVVFTHEIEPAHGVRIVASGDVDASILDALKSFLKQQRQRFFMANIEKLLNAGFSNNPSRDLWYSRELRMALSDEAVQDMDPRWLDRHIHEQVGSDDFVFHFIKPPKNIQVCNEILAEIGLTQLHANIRLATVMG